VPGLETFPTFPSFSFVLEHESGRKLVWDLGIRKDYQNYAPSIASYIPTTKYDLRVTQNVSDILAENGIEGKEIEAVIWRYVVLYIRKACEVKADSDRSHWHWDHIGDPSTFPTTTDLVVGPGFKKALLPGAPANPESPILESDYA